ncbi:DUF7033 domain-containing protein [Hymenobacter sp. GOD-10R]|uniref:DUF7033 domain-containing protein n=1 Tax=Hymenobacter sp. GOD-10R TaxID=3093922 RepID=UPI002D78415F|nr:hypothetical protein [Hymenobacter sp. GOD-10R]WRQ26643.1 hypothetical protein SD425_16340 [Hymenobacter sp. GOD-10R]
MAPILPKISATAVSAEMRLAYVLHHFQQAYAGAATISIGYAGQQPQVEVADGAGDFFERQLPYPSAPNWREWQGRQLPFFFDLASDKPLLELRPDGRAIIHADLISAAFYLLSGWQEYFCEERDRHGRFPFSASVQHRYGFVAVPIVNYYFDILRAAVEHVTSQGLKPLRWAADAPFAAFITHDVDNLFSAWKAPAKAALLRYDWRNFGQRLWQHLTQRDAWDNLAEVQQMVASYGAKSTFFFLPEHRRSANGTPNADYKLRKIWPQAAVDKSEVGLHASLGTAVHAGRLKEDWLKIPVPCSGIRFHYLSWEPRITTTLLHIYNFTHDSTLGFAEHFGFRNSYCLPFQPFLFPNGTAASFLEIPLNVMDATLHHPNYLQLTPDEILPALTPMFQEIERFGGVCTVLWHNENFDPANTHNGPQQFRELMEYLCGRGATFVTGTEVVEILQPSPSD